MTRETRVNIQYYSAIAMLVCGVALTVAGFIVPPTGEISDSVLWFAAQTMLYAGSVFGVNVYVQDKFNSIQEKLGIAGGECTPDGKFSIQDTRCLGCCGLAPVMTINEDVYGKLTPAMVKDILAKY